MNDPNVTRLDYKGKEIILIATAHVSKESAELVRQVIEDERPDSVCIELDRGRYQNIRNPKTWENTDIIKVIKSRRVGFFLANLALSSYQKKIAEQLGTTVGGEIIQGIQSAEDIGAKLILADRDIQITFQRIWRKLSNWEKAKLLVRLLFSLYDDNEVSEMDLKELMQSDMLESVMSGLKKEFPKIGEILIGERDQFLAYRIKNAPGQKVVAVLGGAHVPGVKTEIFQEQDIAKISTVPPKRRLGKFAGWIIPMGILALIAYAFATNIQTGL